MSTALHPTWCDPAHCDVPDRQPLGARGGAHRSKLVALNLEAEARGETGHVYAGLAQSARPRAGVFLKWIINGEVVGHLPLADAEPLAWLIADGLANLRGDDQPIEHAKAPDQ
ncbi:hypothetical protein ACGFZP_12960 [Kitasatospora sp. NPDC048239]|uniref:hypothetical protein n=1 Tax=Kitasatospora sp. NPDC048239 TaxID=3364046 RepID=UPI00371FAF6B